MLSSVALQAQFRLHSRWLSNQTYNSGPDQGVTRIARELIFATPDATTLKIIDPYTVIARQTKPISIDMENGLYVNNINGGFWLKQFEAATNRYVICIGSIRHSDSTGNGRKFGRATDVYLALYKNNLDSTKLTVVEKHVRKSWTVDQKSPRIQSVGASVEQYNRAAVRDSIIFTAAPGTNTGENIRFRQVSLQPTQSIQANIFKPLKLPADWDKEDDDEPLNPTRTSTSFRFMVTHIETLQIDTDDETANSPTDLRNKAEYLGILNAEVITNARVFSVNFFDFPARTNATAPSVRLGLGEKRANPARSNTIFVVPKTQFENAKLRFSGWLSEIDDNYGAEASYKQEKILENNQYKEVLLKNLNSGENFFDIKKAGINATLRVHFEIQELN